MWANRLPSTTRLFFSVCVCGNTLNWRASQLDRLKSSNPPSRSYTPCLHLSIREASESRESEPIKHGNHYFRIIFFWGNFQNCSEIEQTATNTIGKTCQTTITEETDRIISVYIFRWFAWTWTQKQQPTTTQSSVWNHFHVKHIEPINGATKN